MEAARVRACRARWARGAHKGAIEAKSFSLPNPGGGVDLVEDAAFTLVRGGGTLWSVVMVKANRHCYRPSPLGGSVLFQRRAPCTTSTRTFNYLQSRRNYGPSISYWRRTLKTRVVK